MANDAWPASLPQDALANGYREQLSPNVVQSDTDSGRPKRRPRFTKPPRKPIRIPMEMTRAQVATFEEFFETTLNDGVKPFDFTHPRLLTTATFYFNADRGPDIQPLGNGQRWTVNLDLEIDS
ncbi:MAG: hypothetical protein WD270_05515 [Acetobacterales bacterium]